MNDCLNCPQVFPDRIALCNRLFLPGGVKGYAFRSCNDTVFTDMENLSEWASKIAAGSVIASPMSNIKGSMPEADEATKGTDSCAPDRVIMYTHKLELVDENAEDPSIGFTQDVWYNHFNRHYLKYQLAAIDCSDIFYGWIKGFAWSAKRVKDDNNNDGTTHWMVNVAYRQFDHIVPVYIPGLSYTLEFGTPPAS